MLDFCFKYAMSSSQFMHQHFSNTDMKHNNTPWQNWTQLEASHLSTRSQRGAQAGQDKNATCLRRRQNQQTHQCMLISTSNTDYPIPWGRTASSWVESLDPSAQFPQFPFSLFHSILNDSLGFNWLSEYIYSCIIYKMLYCVHSSTDSIWKKIYLES